MTKPDLVTVFEALVDTSDPDACWRWGGYLRPDGYGEFQRQSNGVRMRCRAHRLAYELLVGPIPPGLVLDHLCRNPSCVNPRHLEPVTHQENMKRGYFGTKTHCPSLHEYTPENTYYGQRSDGTGRGRKCRECARIWARRAHARKRAGI